MSFELTIAAGDKRGQRFGFEAAEVALGRAADNDLVLDDASVSRTHARIRARGPGYVLCDGGSTNGTELNGTPVEGSATLHDGDRIGVGAIALQFTALRPPGSRRSGRRLAIAGLLCVAVLGALAGAALGVRRLLGAAGPAPACPAVIEIEEATAGLSFGRGAVDFDCGQAVAFGFTVPANMRARLRYLPRRIGAADEVELKLNGRHLGWATPSKAGGELQTVELPAALLGKDGRNVVAAVQGRAGREWSLSGVSVELTARAPADLKLAREAFERGRRKLEERRVAPRNLYDAWKAFGQARAALEELEPRPPLYAEAARLAQGAERDLGKTCARLLFSAARSEKYGEGTKAQLIYRDVLLHFPGDDPSGCRRRARQGLSAAAPSEEG